MAVFNQWTGIDALNSSSHRLFVQMNEGVGAEGEDNLAMSARLGTVLLGLSNFVGALLAYFTVFNFDRVTCLFWGHVAMGLLHFGVSICILYEQNFVAVLLIVCFILVFQLSEGPILWIYSAEACHDSAFGFVTLAQFVNLSAVAVSFEYIMAGLSPHGTFFFLGGSSLAGAVFLKFFVKETRGLTDIEKKNLYRPVNKVT